MEDFEERPVINAAKRLGLRWCPWMGDWFVSWSPRNDNSNAEGTWEHWVELATQIIEIDLVLKKGDDLIEDLNTRFGGKA